MAVPLYIFVAKVWISGVGRRS